MLSSDGHTFIPTPAGVLRCPLTTLLFLRTDLVSGEGDTQAQASFSSFDSCTCICSENIRCQCSTTFDDRHCIGERYRAIMALLLVVNLHISDVLLTSNFTTIASAYSHASVQLEGH